MKVLQPTTLADLLGVRAGHPGAVLLAGGTDLMVAMNGGRLRPDVVIDTTRVPDLRDWTRDGRSIRLGAGVTYTRLLAELGGDLPGLAMAARTVGSPQIRNRGTVGGNVATSSPAGDALPPLVAADAEVELASVAGIRRLPIAAFLTGPKRNALAPDEVVVALRIPATGAAQQFSKIGTRNAMVIAVASLAIDVDPGSRRVGVAIGSAGPTTLRAPVAEAFVAAAIDWDRHEVDAAAAERFADLAAAAALPIDDVRGTAAYRRHAIAVMARRTLAWALDDLRGRAA
jgi:CO/xanthine dehydrogenase FAD-binding subunit